MGPFLVQSHREWMQGGRPFQPTTHFPLLGQNGPQWDTAAEGTQVPAGTGSGARRGGALLRTKLSSHPVYLHPSLPGTRLVDLAWLFLGPAGVTAGSAGPGDRDDQKTSLPGDICCRLG